MTFLWRVICLSWTQASFSIHPIRRSLTLTLIAIAHILAVVTAGIFSTRVACSNGDVLLTGDSCGWPSLDLLNYSNFTQAELLRVNSLHVAGSWAVERAREYSRSCYDARGFPGAFSCNSLPQTRLPSMLDRDGACPFAAELCSTRSIIAESKYIDSHVDLGVNAPLADRIQMKKRTSCAIVPAEERYSSDWVPNAAPRMIPSDPDRNVSGVWWKQYYLGPQIISGQERPYTFAVSNLSESGNAYRIVEVFQPSCHTIAN
jgi:hypothetical protein